MQILVKVLSGFAYLWFTLASLLVLVSVGFQFYKGGFWFGMGMVQEWFNPFNFLNYLVLFISFLPGLGAYLLAEKLRGKL